VVAVLRLGWPTTESAWPAWELPSRPRPAVIRRADGTPVPALAASDLTAAVLAALGRDGGYDVFHIVRDDGSDHCPEYRQSRGDAGLAAAATLTRRA
jgi:hypothetical protein